MQQFIDYILLLLFLSKGTNAVPSGECDQFFRCYPSATFIIISTLIYVIQVIHTYTSSPVGTVETVETVGTVTVGSVLLLDDGGTGGIRARVEST